MDSKSVLVLGGGIAGLTTALALADLNIDVLVVEQAPFAGGHAVQLSCKATDACVQCGACLVEEKLALVCSHPRISLVTNSRVTGKGKDPAAENVSYNIRIEQRPACIDPEKCTDCGLCQRVCPEAGALLSGFSSQHHPFYAVDDTHCLSLKGGSCRLCEPACPQNAIDLDQPPVSHQTQVDALILATGFSAFDPSSKPYGYGRFPNVITTLELEQTLRRNRLPLRPSDSAVARRIAFIQCVGSRDLQLNHPWCSKICCGSALRLSRLIKYQQPDSEISIFYVDIQTFGPDFETFLYQTRSELNLVRMIPGDVFCTPEQDLQLYYYDTQTQSEQDAQFDLLVLSVGITPNPDNEELVQRWGMPLAEDGFVGHPKQSIDATGIFSTGTLHGPMSIAETVTNAGATVLEVLRFLDRSCLNPKADL